ncbi:hypothetical protein MES5069_220160 [Mesorhizobium escarrei]|uniref:Uncharacterized protein n=1 Tax=Mesorhizobium escarrei TaxID=666018 RepID=A0ABN8JRV7_9HYPH|nr:hypothetical protein MES5069_220160 [Mesorhizobium escarrei]
MRPSIVQHSFRSTLSSSNSAALAARQRALDGWSLARPKGSTYLQAVKKAGHRTDVDEHLGGRTFRLNCAAVEKIVLTDTSRANAIFLRYNEHCPPLIRKDAHRLENFPYQLRIQIQCDPRMPGALAKASSASICAPLASADRT